MVYDLIYNQLIEIFNISGGGWQLTAVEIVSFILTCLFVLIFLAIPLYSFKKVLTFMGSIEINNKEDDPPFQSKKKRR